VHPLVRPGRTRGRLGSQDAEEEWVTSDGDPRGAVRRGLHVGIPEHAKLQRLSAIGMPVFIANGDSDPMILPRYSYLLAGLIPHAWVKIYPDSAQGFLFQHHAEFTADVEAFLAGAS
jgi:pimeloyl-ACP methyl ester carboxylesterase